MVKEKKENEEKAWRVFVAKVIIGCSGLGLVFLLIWDISDIKLLLAPVLVFLLLIFLFGLNLYQSEKESIAI